MPLFLTVALAAGSILLLTTAADGRLWQASHPSMAAAFDAAPYRTVAECLRVAHHSGASSTSCSSTR
jgi:hypothetical protein